MRSSQLHHPIYYDPSVPAPFPAYPEPSKLSKAIFYAGLGYVGACDPHTGAKYFELPLASRGAPYPSGIIPLPASQTAIIASGLGVQRISLVDGKVLWTDDRRDSGTLSMIVGGGVHPTAPDRSPDPLPPYQPGGGMRLPEDLDRPFFVHMRGHLWALRPSTGAVMWSYKPDRWPNLGSIPRLLADADGNVYAGSQGLFQCFDGRTGMLKWSHGSFTVEGCLASFASGNGETNRSQALGIFYTNLK
ncbi:hypothetical protein DFJ73DRAFT_388393 [Zopfochytrium polystomum]|nr:hypothetical protein DFJ73DRAFT_388393 [Zopfochytrium polystomum]